jgi:pimeloyl-ACP methyl ester carboxylesterase
LRHAKNNTDRGDDRPVRVVRHRAAGTGVAAVTWPRSINSYATAVAHNRIAFPLTAGMPEHLALRVLALPGRRPPVRITSNVLMIQNRRDPATPYAGALRLRTAFGVRARLITVDSGGHGAYLANGNACAASGSQAKLSQSCTAQMSPPCQRRFCASKSA